jgi:hypothetical protein
MEYRWLSNKEIEEDVNPVLALHGMALLNINETIPTCQVLGAFEDGHLIQFLAVQLFPVLGPMVRCDNTIRDNGIVSRELAERMHNYMDDCEARAFLVIADNPFTGRICERHKLKQVTSPVYVKIGHRKAN